MKESDLERTMYNTQTNTHIHIYICQKQRACPRHEDTQRSVGTAPLTLNLGSRWTEW